MPTSSARCGCFSIFYNMSCSNKIDFVIPWVDGNDSAWLTEKAKYNYLADTSDKEINSVERYRDWDLLKYWFRGVDQYAPWVNKIHFITWGHVPKFLNVNHPKLHIVNHKDFIPHDCLPLYNASAIETVLDRIPDLSEYFVYFNDDMFLINPVKETDFFVNGKPCGYFEDNPSYTYGNSNYGRMVFNALTIINKHFDKHKQIRMNWRKYYSQSFFSKAFFYTLLSSPWKNVLGIPAPHLPAAFLKTTWEKVRRVEPCVLNDTLHSRFRKSENVQQELFRYWQFMEGNFFPQKIIGRYFHLMDETINEVCHTLKKSDFKEVCLNDGPVTDFEDAKRKIVEAFEIHLPQRSSFEIMSCESR